MRRTIGFALTTLLAAFVLVGLPGVALSRVNLLQVTLPGTNTPKPTVFDFATNTPAGPTSTPSRTPTATNTPTATATASFTPTATPTATDTPSPTPTPNGPFSYPENINPLTGQEYPSQAAKERRNLIVKISNYPPIVRPQTGVNQADMVWEYETEGGVTRFAAIFRNNAPDHVGSVRSARLIDLELVPMYNALLAYSGTSAPIQKLILSSDFVYQTFSPLKGDNCEDAGFCRFPKGDLPFEHTLFLDTNLIWAKATRRNVNTGYKARGLAFNPTPDAGGQPAAEAYIDWYGQADARWQYDEATGHYLRFSDGVPHMDARDGKQLWADDLIILEVPHNDHPDIFDPGVKYLSIQIELWDQGRAYLLRDGQVFQGYWRRKDKEPGSALQLVYGNNIPMMVKPGRSWVSVVRGFGDVFINTTKADMVGTATAIANQATPTIDANALDSSDSAG
ncbi:MAG: DUF3048 domain-containing protein [Anaerolineaceae bacterium]|nr:DUF3048 domain-containing protein [Anaerolineaceae bacterium]